MSLCVCVLCHYLFVHVCMCVAYMHVFVCKCVCMWCVFVCTYLRIHSLERECVIIRTDFYMGHII